MSNLFNLSEEEKNRIRGLHLTESKDLRFTSVLTEAIPGSETCMRVEFKCGDATITPDDITIDLEKYLRPGLEYDGDFAKLKVGVSGPGGEDVNEEVYNKRKQAVIDMLMDAITWTAPDGTEYIQEYLENNIDIDPDWDTTETESVLRDRSRASEDPCDEYYEQFQFIELCFDELKPIPNYTDLANKFLEATIEKTGRTTETVVYDILSQLRHKKDFDKFNDTLKLIGYKGKYMDFYEVACDTAKIPGAEGKTKILWWEVDFIPDDATIGPPELGGGDTTINAHLQRLGLKKIEC